MIRKVPSSVKTSLVDVIMSIKELTQQRNERIFLAVIEKDGDSILLGCNCMSDIIFYFDYFDHYFKEIPDPDEVMIIRGLVVDPEDLPYEAEHGLNIFVLNDDMGTESFFYMSTAATHIEELLTILPGSEIDEFGIVVGTKVSDKIVSAVIRKIEVMRSMRESQEIINNE